jgi:hypothetical protein
VKGTTLLHVYNGLTTLEDEITVFIQDLRIRNRIFGQPLSLDEFLKSVREQEVGDSLEFEGGDNLAIIAAVKQRMQAR